jgi:hypothetical protein
VADGIRLQITIGMPQARTWLRRARRLGPTWDEALDKPTTAAEGYLSSGELMFGLAGLLHNKMPRFAA